MHDIPVRSRSLNAAEISWFAPLCSDDFEFLGVPEHSLKSTFAHTSDILLTAERLGFNNILCPSSYQVGQDTLTFASAVAPQTKTINLLAAIRCGELHPMMLGRTVATLDHILEGRLTLNIISSDMPGERAPSEIRYERSREVIEILKQCWTEESVNYSGEFYQYEGLPTDPVKPYSTGGPLLYFGGMSPHALELCARHCDVFLMWPETEDRLLALMSEVSRRAARYGRVLDFGLRVHVIVRETESEAREYAERLVSKLDDRKGAEIRNRALDARSLGVARQAEMRDLADAEGYAEPHLWTGVGRARSGCGAAIVGDPDQVVAKIERYMEMGMRSFIFSGYPHKRECEYFARLVLPRLERCSLPKVYGRIPEGIPDTPLGKGERR